MESVAIDSTGKPVILDAAAAKENCWIADATGDPIVTAFAKKRTVHAGMTGKPLTGAEADAELERLHAMPRTGESAAYVHIPYCSSKCLYCGFFGGLYNKRTGLSYLDALLRELELEAEYPSTKSAPINALYMGGGTPTELQADELYRLITALKAHLPLAADCEITVEARPHSFTPDKMEACFKAGANRFSLGVQSFHTKTRRILGRVSDRKTVIDVLTRLAGYNQAAVVVDLIYGLPGQTVEAWRDDIKTFLDLPLDGVDLYQLNVFRGSALEEAVSGGRIPPAASLEEQGEYFLSGLELMQGARCRRLSLSHWARTYRERNLYNPLAKKKADCLNYGSGAGGILQGNFLYNQPDPQKYIESCLENHKPVMMVMPPSNQRMIMRSIIEQMEECRLNLGRLTRELEQSPLGALGLSAQALYAPLLENWEASGLVSRDGDWIELTPAGQFWQVNLTQALLDWNEHLLPRVKS